MTTEQLDGRAEEVIKHFTTQIMDLNNNETEYVLEILTQKFEELLTRIQAGERR